MSSPDVRLDTTVTAIGELADTFLAEGIVVLFGDDAPEELQEVAVVHHATVNAGGVSPGDRVLVSGGDGDAVIEVLAVGDVANDNLVNLGHLVLKRNGSTEAALPGDVCCDEGPLPAIAVGDRITVTAPTGAQESSDE